MGGKGGGPRELQFPFALTAAEDGRVWVVDVGKRALVHWGPDGQVLPSQPLPQGYRGGAVKWTTSGIVFPLADLEGQRLALVPGSDHVSVASENAPREVSVLAALPASERKPIQLESCGMGFSGMEPIFSPDLVWTTSQNAVVVARNPEYVLDIYEDGRLVRSLRRDVAARPATAEQAKASLGDGMRVRVEGGERVCDPAEVVEQQGVAPYLPMFERIARAPDGTLWVERFAVGEDAKPVDIFNPDGRYVGTLPEGSPFPAGFLPDGRILVSEKDELDVERLVVRTAEFDRSRRN